MLKPLCMRMPNIHESYTIRSYVTPDELNRCGPVQLRPYHLPFEASLGLKGYTDPDT